MRDITLRLKNVARADAGGPARRFFSATPALFARVFRGGGQLRGLGPEGLRVGCVSLFRPSGGVCESCSAPRGKVEDKSSKTRFAVVLPYAGSCVI
jgi:hypothetical protein